MKEGTVFFDALGRLLTRGGELLALDVAPRLEDPFLRRQTEAIAVFVAELGAAWPELFAALARENAALDAAVRDVAAAPPEPATDDPLARNAALLRALDELLEAHQASSASDAERSVLRLRAGLAEAAVVEQGLLERARASSPTAAIPRR